VAAPHASEGAAPQATPGRWECGRLTPGPLSTEGEQQQPPNATGSGTQPRLAG
jgi:hypothetical protein